jgi:uncharacterized membrane protein SirB2
MRLKNADLIVGLVIVALNVLCVFAPIVSPTWLTTMLALPLIFVLPGHVLTEVLFYRRKIASSHRLLLTLGLSVVIVIISGLLLDLLAPGLQRVSWIVCLSVYIVVGMLLVLARRGKVEGREIRLRRLQIYEYCIFGLALGGVIFALQYANEGVMQQPHPGFTQLWLLPAGGCAVRLGIHSFELSSVAYRLAITANDVSVSTQFPSVLRVGEQFEKTVTVPLATQDGIINVKAQLYRLDRPDEVYRSVNIILHRHTDVSCIGQI